MIVKHGAKVQQKMHICKQMSKKVLKISYARINCSYARSARNLIKLRKNNSQQRKGVILLTTTSTTCFNNIPRKGSARVAQG